MNKALLAALVGVLGLGLGIGVGWMWDTVRGDGSGVPASAPDTTASPTAASS
ncbi:hypothetical protein [Demequina maris]|uniref:hypothetical protein n=1 Tax=Demequina maris TaxID=1638982 RepID=UPI000A86E1D9|nr:hypothetical protein [Demequina maris]